MTVLQLGIFALAAMLIGQLKRGRELALLGASVFVVFWLQPAQQFIGLTFWVPTATIALTVLVWFLISPPEIRSLKNNWSAALVILGVILLFDLNQYFGFESIYMSTTPRIWMLAVVVIFYLIILFALLAMQRSSKILAGAVLWGIILLFVYLKTPYFINNSFEYIYTLRAQEIPNVRFAFLWLGYSYVAFRLIHTIRDHQLGRLAPFTLSEYVNYIIFFPSFTAGPIDRVEKFVHELRNPVALTEQDWVEAGRRFFIGLFKKFVIADSLALIAINDVFVQQVHSAGWMWLFLYMYSLRI